MKIIAAVLCLLLGALRTQAQDVVDYDVVELVEGREVSGDPNWTTRRYGFEYHFASEDNLRSFEAAPERYEIQLGGGCARMGALSGRGDPALHTVHDGHVYIFASEACRETFSKRVDDLLWTDEPIPEFDDGQERRGRELLALAVQAVGGAEAVDAVRNYVERVDETESSDDGVCRTGRAIYLAEAGLRTESYRDDEVWAKILGPDGAWFVEPDGARAMVPGQREALERNLWRQPLMLLYLRNEPFVKLGRVGRGDVNDTAIEWVTITGGGHLATLGIDPESGHAVALTYRGRGPDMSLGTIERSFSDFRRVGDLMLPFASTARFEGERAESLDRQLTSVQINVDLDPTLFTPGS